MFEYKMEELEEDIHEGTFGSIVLKKLKALILKLIRYRHLCIVASLVKS